MGDRAQVHVIEDNESVYLYTHWSGYRVMSDLQKALIKGKSRWTDAPYLARIIFCTMVKGNEEDVTGYGIWSNQMDGVTVTVNVDNQTVSADSFDYDTISFKEFIELDVPELD